MSAWSVSHCATHEIRPELGLSGTTEYRCIPKSFFDVSRSVERRVLTRPKSCVHYSGEIARAKREVGRGGRREDALERGAWGGGVGEGVCVVRL